MILSSGSFHLTVLAVVVAFAVSGCGDDGEGELATAPTTTPGPERTATLSTGGNDGTAPHPSPTRVATAPTGPERAVIRLGTAVGFPGDTVPLEVSLLLLAADSDVVGTQNDILFDPAVSVATNAAGGPDCRPNPAIGKGATAFALRPGSFELRAIVLSFVDLSAIPDGSVLFTCNVAISQDVAPGDVRLGCSNQAAADSKGNPVPVACQAGTVRVIDPGEGRPTRFPTPTITPAAALGTPTSTTTPIPVPSTTGGPRAGLRIGSASGAPGEAVTIDVTLYVQHPDTEIAATQNDIEFARQASVPRRATGPPDCEPNPGIGKNATAFAFQPPGCADLGKCTGVRGIVLSFVDTDPIPDGSILYSCRVQIAADVLPGSRVPLRCSQALGSAPEGALDPFGGPIALACEDGEVLVRE